MDDDLRRVKDLFELYRVDHLLVLVGERLVGVISDRDLPRAKSPFTGHAEPAGSSDHDPEARLRGAGYPVAEAAKLMLEKRISCLPVVNDEGQVLGIVTWRDQMRSLLPL